MRHLLRAVVFPTVLGMTALACGSAGMDDATRSTAAAVSGATAKAGPVKMGVDAMGNPEFQKATGLSAEVVRVYLKQGKSIPSSTKEAGLDTYYAAGQGVVYSMKVDDSPDSEATNKANLTALAKNIVSEGHASTTWIALHHEPYPELSASAFQTMYATYAPSVRAAGVQCGVIYQTYPMYHQLASTSYVADYTSGILADVDFIGIDVYPGGLPGGYTGNILADISPVTDYAKANGKKFQIDEIAVDDTVSGTQAQQATWLSGLANLGGDIELIMYYEGSPGAFDSLHIENDPDAVTEWQKLYKQLTTR